MKVWIKAVITLSLLGALVIFAPLGELWQQAQRIDPLVWFSALAAVSVTHLVLGVFKWRLVINAGKARLGWRDAVRCYGAGLFANIYLPSIVGGDGLRAILAGRATGRGAAVVMGGVADRLLDVMALALLVVVGLLGARSELPPWADTLALGVIGLGVLVGGVGVIVFAKMPIRRVAGRRWKTVSRLLVAARRMARNGRVAALVLLTALSMQAVFALLNAWFGHAVGIDVSIWIWFFAFGAAKFAALMPISIAGFGVREASLAAVLLVVAVPSEQAVLVSLLWGTMLVGSGLVGGLMWVVLGNANDQRMTTRSRRQARTSSATPRA